MRAVAVGAGGKGTRRCASLCAGAIGGVGSTWGTGRGYRKAAAFEFPTGHAVAHTSSVLPIAPNSAAAILACFRGGLPAQHPALHALHAHQWRPPLCPSAPAGTLTSARASALSARVASTATCTATAGWRYSRTGRGGGRERMPQERGPARPIMPWMGNGRGCTARAVRRRQGDVPGPCADARADASIHAPVVCMHACMPAALLQPLPPPLPVPHTHTTFGRSRCCGAPATRTGGCAYCSPFASPTSSTPRRSALHAQRGPGAGGWG